MKSHLALFFTLALAGVGISKEVDYTKYVNAFIGSEGPIPGTGFGGGDIFVGGARPFGVTKVGIDTTAKNWTTAVLNGGWTPDGDVTGISMMHESGTGGAPKYGVIAQMPLTDIEDVNVLDNTTYAQARVSLFIFFEGSIWNL